MDPFGFSIVDRDNAKEVLIQTAGRKFVMASKFKEMGFQIHSQNVYGLGLSNRKFTLEPGAYTMFARNRKGGSVLDESLGG